MKIKKSIIFVLTISFFQSKIYAQQVIYSPRNVYSVDGVEEIGELENIDTLYFFVDKMKINGLDIVLKNNRYSDSLIIDNLLITQWFNGEFIQRRNKFIFTDHENLFVVDSASHTFTRFKLIPGLCITGKNKKGTWVSFPFSYTTAMINDKKIYPDCNILVDRNGKLKIRKLKNQGKLTTDKNNFKTKIYRRRCIYISDNYQIYRHSESLNEGKNDSLILILKKNQKEVELKDIPFPEYNQFYDYQGTLYYFDYEEEKLFKLNDNKFELVKVFTLPRNNMNGYDFNENEIYDFRFINNKLFFLRKTVPSLSAWQFEKFYELGNLYVYDLSHQHFKHICLKQK